MSNRIHKEFHKMMFLRVIRNQTVLGAALIAMGMFFVPVSAQAACDGGTCPIVGGSLRTMVGGGFIIPQVSTVSPGTAPTGQMHGTTNPANGAIRPRLGGAPHIDVPLSQVTGPSTPRSFTIPIGQLTYGSAPSAAPGYYTAPVLVQVPLNGFVAALMGVSTNIGQSFPGDVRWLPSSKTSSMAPGVQTVIGGPAVLKKGGRPGAATLTSCAGAIVPLSIPGTWQGGCVGFTPTTGGSSMMTGTQVAPALMRYTKTSNQFGGAGSQRQVKRTATSTASNNWLGRINFNNFIAPYTAADMAMTSVKKVYPTLPQNLVEPVVWGAPFGAVVQRLGAAPGNMVSALLTMNGKPQNTTTVMITNNGTPTGPGTGMGLVQTSTSWGGPLTTGMVTVQVIPTDTNVLPSTWAVTGSSHRDSAGNGYISLVSGSVSARNLSGPGTSRTMLTLAVPEPAMAFGLIAGVLALAGLSRRRD